MIEQHAAALADAVEAAIPGWVQRSVRRRVDTDDPELTAAAAAAGRQAAQVVGAQVRALLEADIDQQATTPLALLRAAVRYPTAVLGSAGVAPVARDDFSSERFPDDLYDLTPATLADVDPALAEPGIAWGAAKAWAHRARHAPREEAR